MRRRQFFDLKEEFFAGIEYINETETETNLNDGLDFVTFTEDFKPLEINKQFSVNKNELVVLKTKPNSLVSLKWEVFVKSKDSKEKTSLSFRILQNKKVIDSTRINGHGSNDLNGIQNFGNTLVHINPKDTFTIQIKNIDLEKPTDKIIVKIARLILEN